ncbi:Aldo/keto reductase [Daedalea quercina L-15889]|uniref:Aldo/keto reductase n=1 Tax=Daedalea quercina L-15889 TaxID=1314783 RepID=A0A165LFS7_9APHY|nr:Aldo/keto reductase [Daedalea quercina L-15889]
MPAAVSSRHFTLNNGTSIPAVGVGCWMGVCGEGEHVTTMVKTALDLGYRHIDTAENYGNEQSVGKALRESRVPRDELFLTTKLDQSDHGRVKEAFTTSLTKLGVDYVDLYLMHWPMAYDESGNTLQPEDSPTLVETWREMERLLSDGKAKAIGVSNFSVQTLTELLAHASVVPAVNQVELHPCLPQHELVDFCSKRGILLTAYSPVGKTKFADDPAITAIASGHGPAVTNAQVLLSWGVQRGTAVIPKTVHAERLKENLQVIFSVPFCGGPDDLEHSGQLVHLSAAEMETLDQFHGKPGMHRSVCGFHSAELGGSCFGWTYAQLGWAMAVGGIHL